MKTRILLIALIFGLVLSGCASQAKAESMPEGPERDAVVADTDVFAQDIVSGLDNSDYATFSKDFDQTMTASITKEAFDNLVKQFGTLGKSESIELQDVQINGEYYSAIYKVNYGSQQVTIRLVVNQDAPRLVSGLWFK